MSDQYEWIREEYGCFFDEVYSTYEDFEDRYLSGCPDYRVIGKQRVNGVTLVTVTNGNGTKNEIIVIEE